LFKFLFETLVASWHKCIYMMTPFHILANWRLEVDLRVGAAPGPTKHRALEWDRFVYWCVFSKERCKKHNNPRVYLLPLHKWIFRY